MPSKKHPDAQQQASDSRINNNAENNIPTTHEIAGKFAGELGLTKIQGKADDRGGRRLRVWSFPRRRRARRKCRLPRLRSNVRRLHLCRRGEAIRQDGESNSAKTSILYHQIIRHNFVPAENTLSSAEVGRCRDSASRRHGSTGVNCRIHIRRCRQAGTLRRMLRSNRR